MVATKVYVDSKGSRQYLIGNHSILIGNHSILIGYQKIKKITNSEERCKNVLKYSILSPL